MSDIEFIVERTSRTNWWSKFFVKDLREWAVAEDFRENRSSEDFYIQGYVCLNIPEGTIFTVFDQSGTMHGTSIFNFYICQVFDREDTVLEIAAVEGSGRIEGDFKIICAARGKIKAHRLMTWWNSSEDHSLQFAEHCAAHISRRGVKHLPAMEAQQSVEKDSRIKLLEAIADAVRKLLDNATGTEGHYDSSAYGVDRDYILKLRDCLRKLEELE